MFIISNDHLPTVICVHPDGSWSCLGSHPNMYAANEAVSMWTAGATDGSTFYVSSMSTTDIFSHFGDELPTAA